MNAPLKLPELVRSLSADFAQRAAAHDRDASFPFENFSDLHQAGLLTLAAPISLGGQGATLAQLSDVIGAIGKGDPATALVLIMQFTQHRSLARGGNRWPKALAQRVVREAAEKGALINALRVEPELGSPARGGLPATIACQTPQGWRVSGRKLYSTGAPILSWYALWVRTDEAEPRVGYLLVPAGLAGTRIEETWDHLGLRASGSHDVVFEDVLVPFENAVDLRLPAEWLGADPQAQAEIAVLISALYTGVAEAARDWLLGFLHARKPSSLGASLATLPRAQEVVGRIESLLLTNQRLIAGLARGLDDGVFPSANEAGLIKSVTTNNAVQAVELAQSLTSNHGLTRHNPLERHWRDVLCGRIHTPQDDSVWITAGRKALGI